MLNGRVNIPSSKSIAHRAIICGGLAAGKSRISNLDFSDDLLATADGMSCLGAELEKKQSGLIVDGTKFKQEQNSNFTKIIDCNESGTSLRLLLPLSLSRQGSFVFKCRGNLGKRPLDPYFKIFERQGIEYSFTQDRLQLKVRGCLRPDEFSLRGDLSSQFISGLLLALPLLEGDSKLIITTELESKGYVDLTLDLLEKFGLEVQNSNYREFYLPGRQEYRPQNINLEGDFSQAAFYLVAGILGSNVECNGLDIDSLQGDKAILELIDSMGGRLKITKQSIKGLNSSTKGSVIDGSQIPDLVPVLAVLAALSSGTTKIVNAGRLRIKESDRLQAVCDGLYRLGAEINQLDDGLLIKGREYLVGGQVDSWNDHRIAMALAIASTRCKNPVIITNSDVVKKSYPGFWDDFKSLGGKIDEWNLG